MPVLLPVHLGALLLRVEGVEEGGVDGLHLHQLPLIRGAGELEVAALVGGEEGGLGEGEGGGGGRHHGHRRVGGVRNALQHKARNILNCAIPKVGWKIS